MTKEKEKIIGMGFSIILIIIVLIRISQILFPYFFIGSILLLLVLSVSLVLEIFFKEHTYDIWDYFSTYIGLIFIICFICAGITYLIGYGLAGTSIGEASLQVYDSVNQAETQFDNSIFQVIDESCKTLDERSCLILKQNYNTFKTVKEVSDMADNLRKGTTIVEKVSK